MNSLVLKHFEIATKNFPNLQKAVFKANKTGQKSKLSSTLILRTLHETYAEVAVQTFSVKKSDPKNISETT